MDNKKVSQRGSRFHQMLSTKVKSLFSEELFKIDFQERKLKSYRVRQKIAYTVKIIAKSESGYEMNLQDILNQIVNRFSNFHPELIDNYNHLIKDTTEVPEDFDDFIDDEEDNRLVLVKDLNFDVVVDYHINWSEKQVEDFIRKIPGVAELYLGYHERHAMDLNALLASNPNFTSKDATKFLDIPAEDVKK